MHILALSGSLRAASSNTTLLRACVALAPVGVDVVLYDRLGDLPHFNPDLDGEGTDAPPAVAEFRATLTHADAVLICSPEYAHGVPGVLKNALDWIVSSGEFENKPVALLSASTRATYARASLWETLTVMMAHLVDDASVTVNLSRNSVDEAAVIADPFIAPVLSQALVALAKAAST